MASEPASSGQISIVIKTFERPACLERMLASIAAQKLPYPILIADDSRHSAKASILKRFPYLDIEYFELPFDSGISVGRNVLLRGVKTEYFLLCDDDFVFDGRADIEAARYRLEVRGLDILGGVVFNKAGSVRALLRNLLRPKPERRLYNIRFYEEPATHTLLLDPAAQAAIWREVKPTERELDCDIVNNFFLARTESIRQIGGWHEELKVQEHHPFFLKAKQAGLRVGFDATLGIAHRPSRPASYRRFRYRDVAAEKRKVYAELQKRDST